ncbi:MAG: hypothetical protein WCK63_03605 [Betaproteobacteria bacterium]
MLSPAQFLLAFALSCGLMSGKIAAQPLPTGHSEFIFADARSNPDKPITAWCYKPTTATHDSRIVFVMTGVQRNAAEYRSNWAHHADKYNFILIVPEFPRRYYNKDDDYTFGGVTQQNKAKWGFSTLEHLFDEVRQREGLSAEKYSIYGHSAGAQFTHRLMLFMGDSVRVDIAIAANSGWYTMPIYAVDSRFSFPHTLDPRIVPESALPRLFANRLFILLGDQDTDVNAKSLNRSPTAMAQGAHRFARGHNFYHQSKLQAIALGTPFNWELIDVPGIGHSDKGMSDAAIKVLFND